MAKQIIVLRKDLNMTKGKMVAQGSHASLGVILDMMIKQEHTTPIPHTSLSLIVPSDSPLSDWLTGIFTKVCLYVNSEEELDEICRQADAAGLPVKMIVDRGLTMFHGIPTKTCIAIGPDENEKIDAITGHLKLL
jgi:PTH2 family peptidyl-tRNA hydrolase